MDNQSKGKAVRGVAWTGVANWGSQLLSFCFYSVLARLLSPHEFGLIALAGVYVAFIQILVTQGFGMAIVQRRDLEEEHLDSAFWIAMATAVALSLLSFLLAGIIGNFFKEPRIVPVIKWLCLSMVFYGLSSVQTAILTRELNFRALAVRSLAATVVGGAVGVTMAYRGWGVWSLVAQQIVGAAFGCICLWLAVSWRPKLLFSRSHLHDLYGFSLGVAGNDVLWFFSQKSDQTLVGYGFGAAGLGPYSLASKVVTLAYEAVVGPFQAVAFPAFSKLQSDPGGFEKALQKFCKMSSFLCLPVFTGIAVIAPELVPVLFGPRWVAAVPLLQVLSIYGAVRVILTFMHPLMLAKGRAGLYLVMNIILSALTFACCLCAMRWGPEAIAFSMVISLSSFLAIFLVVAQKSLQVRALPLLKSFILPAVCSLTILITVDAMRAVLAGKIAPAAALAVYILTGVLTYASAALLLGRDLVKAMREMVSGSLIPSRWRGSMDLSSIEDDIEVTTIGSTKA
jgi:PST family polysaccharide transporter